ncbi:MAG TPA: IscS subfamily cysteine desulfurase [Firmicutes bacterium]|nr:IscS subfamily cysteine desulfurase [Bacillota bacterium]
MTVKTPIYLDHNATTSVDPRVLEAMMPYFTTRFGNAASRSHSFGWEAMDAVDRAREQIARLIGAEVKEIIFTSGATESDNIALKGVMENYQSKGNHLITAATEHKAVLDTAKYLEKKGYAVSILPVQEDGRVDTDLLDATITKNTVLISLMLANNETGVLHPVHEIGKIAEKHDVLFHCDATQAVGKVRIDVKEMGIHLMSMSGHKIYGPKGVGVLYVRSKSPKVNAAPVIHGGGHERGFRSGTLNVPGIVGMGAACELCGKEFDEEVPRLRGLRDKLENGITGGLEHVYVNGHPTERLVSTSNISFEWVEGEGIMLSMKEIAVSSGSACTSASLEPSFVLHAMGRSDELSHGSLRFSLGRWTTEDEIDYTVIRVIETVNRLREMSPLYEMSRKGVDLSKVEWNDEH